MDEARLTELAASLRSTGLIQPIVVRKIGEHYELIAGERRWRASKLAGLVSIPAFVREVDGFTQAQMALVENIQREDLNPMDRAQAYRVLIDQLGLTQSELSNRLGEDRSSIANFLRLLELAGPVKNQVRDGQLTLGHAKLLAGVSDVVEQQRLADLVINQELSVRNLERLIQQGPAVAEPITRPTPSAHLQDLERSLTRQLGMKVQVKSTSKKGRGRMVIHYSSLDQFDELLSKLGVSSEE
jgi:ParB family chromosome partitioning protein